MSEADPNDDDEQNVTVDSLAFVSQVIENFYRIGINWQGSGDFDSAIVVYRLILGLRKLNPDVDCPELVLACDNLADILATQGKWMEAEHYYLEAVSTSVQMFGSKHPSSALSLRNYAEFLRSMSLDDEADCVFEQAQMIFAEYYQHLMSTTPVAETNDPGNQAEVLLFRFNKQRLRRRGLDAKEYNVS